MRPTLCQAVQQHVTGDTSPGLRKLRLSKSIVHARSVEAEPTLLGIFQRSWCCQGICIYQTHVTKSDVPSIGGICLQNASVHRTHVPKAIAM